MRDIRHLLIISALLFAFFGCNRPNEVDNSALKTSYIAINGADTARLNLVVKGTTFKGKCAISFNNKYTDSGEVRGRINGDTLLGDFHYLHYGSEWKRIAIAFLKKDDKLVMGEGKQSVYLNIPFFRAGQPIRYDSVKFVFIKTPNIL
ncbi:hypothetical protein IWX76_001987 [Pedobacter sp. CAN_A7]|uniref:hypothetical protein n=1 Tax=Pedobacter sp. CAN_A7 TaxID=2787722 RepID=UPI0018CA39B2